MILRILPILLTIAAAAIIWFAYDQLNILRRTVLWEFRYLLLIIAAFLLLSIFEWAIGWLRHKIEGEEVKK